MLWSRMELASPAFLQFITSLPYGTQHVSIFSAVQALMHLGICLLEWQKVQMTNKKAVPFWWFSKASQLSKDSAGGRMCSYTAKDWTGQGVSGSKASKREKVFDYTARAWVERGLSGTVAFLTWPWGRSCVRRPVLTCTTFMLATAELNTAFGMLTLSVTHNSVD